MCQAAPCLSSGLAAAKAIALGPGLGQGAWGCALYSAVSGGEAPTVLDADALNLLAEQPRPLPANTVLTPHPGEAARLLACTTAAIQADRLAAVQALRDRYGALDARFRAMTGEAVNPGVKEATRRLEKLRGP